jgi:ABC-type branched-subunit amino acid transport system substrate-binding protein
MQQIIKSIGSDVLSAVVGSGNDEETSASHMLLQGYNVMQLHTRAMNVEFGNGLKYPFKIQTTPVDSFQGMVLQNIICKEYQYHLVTVFATNDDLGTKLAMESTDGTYCNVQKLSVHFVRPGTTDFSEEIQIAKDAGASVFFIFADPVTTGYILYRGYTAGLFHSGTQIFSTKSIISNKTWSMIPSNFVPSIMKGIIAIEYLPSYSLFTNYSFANRFQKQPSTVGSLCYKRDDYNSSLYRSQSSICSSLKFSQFSKNGSNIAPFASHAYDAVWAIARALHKLKLKGISNITGGALHDVLVKNVSFVGATGSFEWYGGMPNFGYYAAGDREVGHHYRVVNFNEQLYKQSKGTSGWATVGVWSVEDEVVWSDPILSKYEKMYPVVYNTPDNSRPSDLAPYQTATAPSIVRIGGLFSPIDVNGNFDYEQAQCLAAFMMAVNEINNKKDGINDDILPQTKLVVAVRSPGRFYDNVDAARQLANVRNIFHMRERDL